MTAKRYVGWAFFLFVVGIFAFSFAINLP